MSGGPFSPTKTQTATASTQTTSLTTTNKNVSGNAGITNTVDEGSTVNLSYAPVEINTDAGAVNAGAYVANAGISATTTAAALAINSVGKANDNIRMLAADAVTANSDLALQLAGGVINAAKASSSGANAITSHALDIVDATTRSNAENARDYAEGVVNFAGGVLTQFGNKLAEYQQSEQTQLGNVVSALSASFVDNSKTADQRVTDATLQAGAQSADVITSVAKYAAIAIAVGVLGYILIKKA